MSYWFAREATNAAAKTWRGSHRAVTKPASASRPFSGWPIPKYERARAITTSGCIRFDAGSTATDRTGAAPFVCTTCPLFWFGVLVSATPLYHRDFRSPTGRYTTSFTQSGPLKGNSRGCLHPFRTLYLAIVGTLSDIFVFDHKRQTVLLLKRFDLCAYHS